MKNKFSISMTLALIMAMLFTSVGLADNVQNDVTVNGSDTFILGGTTTVNYRISATGAGNDGQNGCNAADTTPATVTINVPGNVTANPASLTFTDCGVANEKAVVFSASVAGNYPITVSVSDSGTGTYTTSQAAFTLKVLAPAKTNPTITWATPADIVYGTALSGTQLNATASVPGAFVYSPAAGTVLAAGLGQTLHVDFTSTDTTLYNNASKDVTINVLKANPGCSISGYTGTFDGFAHGASGSCTGVGTLDFGASFTAVPGGTANWSFSGGANYLDDSGTASIVISAAPVTATAGGGTSTYDGSSKSPSACVVSGPYTGDLSCANDPTSVGPDAGTTAIAPDVSGTGLTNFAVTPVNGSYTIEKADATCTISGFTGVYDGLPHGATGSCTGVGGVDLSAGLTLGATFTDYPGGTAYWSFSGGTNYNDQSSSVAITINKAPVTATAGNGSTTFDGAAHSPSACAVTGAYTGDLTCANNPSSVGPNAATYTILPVVSGTGLGNFDVTLVNGSYTINKADASCTVTGYSVYYDGFAHTATGSCTGVLSETLSGLNLSGTTHTLVGDWTDNWTFTDVTGNYNDTFGTVEDEILGWTLTGFYAPVDKGIHNIVKGGATVPLKFEVFAGPTELTDTSIISAFTQKIACAAGAGDAIEQYSTGNTSLRYDTTSGQFIFNWKTLKAPGSCYRVTMTTLDGSSIFADFTLK